MAARDGAALTSLQAVFELPPPAAPIDNDTLSAASSTASTSSSASSSISNLANVNTNGMPSSSSTTNNTRPRRRRTSTAANVKPEENTFALPPPPTRVRKIIQVKPKNVATSIDTSSNMETDPSTTPTATSTSISKKSTSGKGSILFPSTSSSKKKPGTTPSSTAASALTTTTTTATTTPTATAAGRKIARKTAHSLIERRRRCKMNEEFAVLKDMIPACTGEMHKLAILQATIDYMRYLKDCVAKLEENNQQREKNPLAKDDSSFQKPPIPNHAILETRQHSSNQSPHEYASAETTPTTTDVEMGDTTDPPSTTISTSSTPHPSASSTPLTRQQGPSPISPTLPVDAANSAAAAAAAAAAHRHRQNSYSSIDHFNYYATSAATSPAFGPQAYPGPNPGYVFAAKSGHASSTASALTSPALQPQRDLDHEATAALLMLNADRRGLGGTGTNGTGFSFSANNSNNNSSNNLVGMNHGGGYGGLMNHGSGGKSATSYHPQQHQQQQQQAQQPARGLSVRDLLSA